MTTTVALLTEWIERQFPIGQPTRIYRAVTGEHYVTIGQSLTPSSQPGVVDQGEPREVGLDEESACMSAASAFADYAKGRTGVLYWRAKPELVWGFGARRCVAHMRLLISDKPPIHKET
jgi:hypothetical protein